MIDWLKTLLGLGRKADSDRTRDQASRENLNKTADDFNQSVILMSVKSRRTRAHTRSEVGLRALPPRA